jgi:FkbM family methyltransferase
MASEHHLERLRQAEEMIRQTNISGARDVLRELVDQSDDLDVQKSASIHIVELACFEDFHPAKIALAANVRRGAPDGRTLRNYAYVCFALEDFLECIQAARAALVCEPLDFNAMKTLGMAYLVTKQPIDAFLAFSTGVFMAPKGNLGGFQNLAMQMMQGQQIAKFSIDGQDFQFHLRTDNGQMMEAALYHVHGTFTEMEELRLIRDRVRSSTALVEVGTMVGNHLVYFLKTLKPKKAFVFDISARSIEASRENVRLNEPYASRPDLVFKPIGISGKSGTIAGPDGHPAETTSLDEAVLDDVDFIKIDVDGIEMEVLAGARQLIGRCRPMIMIEVSRAREPTFHNFLTEVDYRVVAEIDRGIYKNILVEAR